MRTRNLDEAIDAVTKVYCPHKVRVDGPDRDVDVVLEIAQPTSQPLVELSYGAPVEIDAGNFPQLFLMMHCADGRASTVQGAQRAEWHCGQTLPFSAGLETRLRLDKAFVQKAIRLNAHGLETLCARWVGDPLRHPLRFALQPFSEDFERTWRRTLSYLWSADDGGLVLGAAARAAFDEYLLTLLLQRHPHNYSGKVNEASPTPVPGLVRRAERFIIDHAATPITVSDVAADLGISLRSLQAGFRQWRATTPNLFLRQVRLQLVRDELLRSGTRADVTTTALRYGFSHLGRFSAYYLAAFGEVPSETRRRGRATSAVRRRN